MIIRNDNFTLISANSNSTYRDPSRHHWSVYWEEVLHPSWAAINAFHLYHQEIGNGVEPHYHDADEYWLFTEGRGEVWLDSQSFPITPNSAVYTPMGAVQRFQMFSDGAMVAVPTRLERQKRARHIVIEEEGPPAPTVPGFFVAGDSNLAAFPDRGTRSPLSELRVVTLPELGEVQEGNLPANEYWLTLSGKAILNICQLDFELSPGDLALLRAGAVRRLRSVEGARLALARE